MRQALKGRVEQYDHPNGSERREEQKRPDHTNPMTVIHGCFLYIITPLASNIYSDSTTLKAHSIFVNYCPSASCTAASRLAYEVLIVAHETLFNLHCFFNNVRPVAACSADQCARQLVRSDAAHSLAFRHRHGRYQWRFSYVATHKSGGQKEEGSSRRFHLAGT